MAPASGKVSASKANSTAICRARQTVRHLRTGATQHRKPVCLVLGAGAGIGQAVASRFAREGYFACVVRRGGGTSSMNDEDTRTKLASFVEKLKTEGCAAKAFFVDATDPTAVSHLVAEIEKNIGPIEVAVYNIGAQVGSRSLERTSYRVFEQAWRMGSLGAFAMAKEVAPFMQARGTGTMIFTSATAAYRGGSGQHAHTAAMSGRKNLAQSLNAELASNGIHICQFFDQVSQANKQVRSAIPHSLQSATVYGVHTDNADALASCAAVVAQWRQKSTALTRELRPALGHQRNATALADLQAKETASRVGVGESILAACRLQQDDAIAAACADVRALCSARDRLLRVCGEMIAPGDVVVHAGVKKHSLRALLKTQALGMADVRTETADEPAVRHHRTAANVLATVHERVRTAGTGVGETAVVQAVLNNTNADATFRDCAACRLVLDTFVAAIQTAASATAARIEVAERDRDADMRALNMAHDQFKAAVSAITAEYA